MDDISHRRLNIIGCKFDTLVGVSAAALITCGICLYFGNFLESSILIFPFSFWQGFFMWNFVSFWQFSHFLESSILPFPLFFWQGGSCRDVGSKKRNPPLLSRFRPWISKKVLCVRPSLHAQTITSSTLPSTNESFLFLFIFSWPILVLSRFCPWIARKSSMSDQLLCTLKPTTLPFTNESFLFYTFKIRFCFCTWIRPNICCIRPSGEWNS